MAQNFNLKKLAKDILAKRTKENISFRDITKQLKSKVHFSSVQRIEDATQMPSAETLGVLCDWLSKPVSEYYK